MKCHFRGKKRFPGELRGSYLQNRFENEASDLVYLIFTRKLVFIELEYLSVFIHGALKVERIFLI